MDVRSEEYDAPSKSFSPSSSAASSSSPHEYNEYNGALENFITSLIMNSNLLHRTLIKSNWTFDWTTIAFFVMRPETFAFVTAIIVILFLSHTTDCWFPTSLAHKLTRTKWMKFLHSAISDESDEEQIDRVSLFTSSGLHDSYSLKHKNIGLHAIRGRRKKMEDMFDYVNEISRFGIELFGVFDGHGSDKASIFTRKNLFPAIVSRISETLKKSSDGTCNNDKDALQVGKTHQSNSNKVSCDAGDSKSEFASFLHNNRILSNEIKKIVSEEILSLDQKMLSLGRRDFEFGGTTAIIAVRLHSLNRLVVANVGDSRGILCNSRGMVVPMSHDHKPNHPSEHRRIREAGGFIKFNGVWRVAGILATSRALGDSQLKDQKFITAEPEIMTFELGDHQPQFMILASDGLWDTFGNEDAAKFVMDTIANLRKKGRTEDLAFEAARALTHEAYKKLSLDNITVLIVIFDPKEFHSTSTSFGIYSSQRFKQQQER